MMECTFPACESNTRENLEKQKYLIPPATPSEFGSRIDRVFLVYQLVKNGGAADR